MKIHCETLSMQTRDGVRLDADVYRPETATELPVLLMRQPYGRAIASTVVYAHPRWYAARGYIVVIQDVRGRGTSQGEFRPFEGEVADGEDTVNWAAQLPGSNGKVGMYGFSYQGMTQLYAAMAKPPALKVLCPGMLGYNLRDDWAYENGAFCWQINLGWAVQLAAETARLWGDEVAYGVLCEAARNLPLQEPSPRFVESFRKYTPGGFYFQWRSRYSDLEYWQTRSPSLQEVDLPMLHIGGWFDPYLRGNLRLYEEMSQKSRFPQHLIVGPWTHLIWGRKAGQIDFGTTAQSFVDTWQIRWFDYFLKDSKTVALPAKPIHWFEMGSNQWRELESWEGDREEIYYCRSNGLASMREDAGVLSRECPEDAAEDVFVRDPWRPVPALGGHAAIPAGMMARSHLEGRSDILTYTTPTLTADITILGVVVVTIYCEVDAPSFDLCAVLSVVDPQQEVYNFTQGYIRVNDGATPVRLPLQATCMRIKAGNCLRLSLSADCYPAYRINPGNQPEAGNNSIDARILTFSNKSGGDTPSKLSLRCIS
ncbi:MAG: CocE/NonD family hydrolase [Jaaginema sp. PMC 1079.18]|nr:CocE/NonD family hydrolase [Jaaginema sp. PMC 1080.18]MEC4849405.1 CocE/NonD family hydrolase [Jaaginema sp. PMC 1079.18]MEC4864963.1 CocE/NonD family hydrolase [Jaaginema sp. PMC 1078.18]